jgi:glycine/sarcosine/betaine reductase component B subunit
MRLELEWCHVTSVALGAATRRLAGALEIDTTGLAAELGGDPRLARVEIDLAHPGELCRIANVFDVFAPRALEDGADFPGLLGPPGPRSVQSDARAGRRVGGPDAQRREGRLTDNGRLRHGDGTHGRSDRCQRSFVLPILQTLSTIIPF